VPEDQRLKSLLIAVPTTGGSMKAKTAESLVNLMRALTQHGIAAQLYNINNSDIVTVRNMYANMVLDSDRWDGLLFIDSDMQFTPRVINRMISLNEPVSAAACTKRHIDLEKFGESMRDHGDIELAQAEAVKFNTMLRWDNRKKARIRHRAGFYTMAAVGMAVCLIRRSALQLMVDEGAVEERMDVYDGIPKKSWAFFDFIKYSGVTLTEDYSFCHRWTHVMQRNLWICTDEIVHHIGDFPYSGRYSLIFEKTIGAEATAKLAGAQAAR
jgi:hypothetical protein